MASDHNTDFHLAHSYLEGFEPFKVDNPMLPMLTIARKKNYQYDHEQYGGLMEVWQSSRQSYYYPSGDCEDHAILLTDWLIESGYNAYVALGKYDNEGHAWVVLFIDGKEYVLEATQKSGFGRKYPLASTLPKYQPQYRFNRTEFWLNTGSSKITQYASKHWKLMSRYSKQVL
ncbi:transglutaminase-like domain-containing protein [Vibrio mexicanus]|uniref:transglutaminase-like domain-containing protein n=1 Tax=Vibrio mexicanus TaxID=1004326 RepID=UPI001EE32A60|nr:transglutaminase-like domain-containing protein [Vibrio mexicanus]